MDIETFDEYEDDVGLGQEDKKHAKSNQVDWFKGEQGKTYRVALTYFHPMEASVIRAVKKQKPDATKEELIEAIKKAVAKRAEELGKKPDELADYEKLDYKNVRFKKIEANFKEGFGYCLSRLGKDGPEADAVWKTMGDVKNYFTSTMLIYPTNSDGEIIREQLKSECVVKPVRFSSRVYGTFHARSSSLRENSIAISTQDIMLTCTNTGFQNFDIDAAGPAVWLKNDGFRNTVLAKSHALYPKLVPFREISTADLKIKLGITTGGGGSESIGDEDFAGLLDSV